MLLCRERNDSPVDRVEKKVKLKPHGNVPEAWHSRVKK